MNFNDYKIMCSLYVKGILQDFLQIPKPTTTTTKTVGLSDMFREVAGFTNNLLNLTASNLFSPQL